MRLRSAFPLLTLAVFLFVSGTAMAGIAQWLDLDGFLSSAGDDSITFQTGDQGSETDATGSIVFTAVTGGEFVKKLPLPDDFWVYKVHMCFAKNNTPDNDVIVKIYGPNPLATEQTIVLFQHTIQQADLLECSEVLVFDPAANPPSTPITPANGPLFVSIGITGTAYIKAVGVEEFSEYFEIDGCDTGVMDRLFDSGQLLSAVVALCEEGPPKNHGQYVKCVSHTLNDLKKSGYITSKEKGKIQRCAAKADIP